MPSLHVCSLSRLEATVAASGASHVATLINAGTPVPRPATIPADNHLFLGFNDIVEPTAGMITVGEAEVLRLFDFVDAWSRERPMVIHCWAGISRSTAGAFVTACRLMPERAEDDIARELRVKSPSATPNLRLVRIADALMGRGGRMAKAIEAIGRGRDAFEGVPFVLPIERAAP
ncbi:tyrosine phosphatase family protein [Pinisolibacter aquiterrae]|uniref:tyrosine phosphatase family protein n=1 Tax=Pinisolibacter aquiterrae TaxID=2815579 RepID=UPI001C3E2CB2|nr:tyrosine phosphatase family protein [Pinisolibacter aquiterrae]MBV5262580.1 tyrosine phosphatase family protein [Pinisolibacter aquiterrae]MCC8237032.1 tyrosine phosphatase family protein [Pinisolibacter aquiterrae]